MDIRKTRTLMMLVGAFDELASEKAMDDITVTEICARSTVRRNTFYRHFCDKYEFIEFYLKTIVDSFMTEAEAGPDFDDIYSYSLHMHRSLIGFMETHQDFVRHNIGQSTVVGTLDMIVRQIADGITTRAQEEMKQAGKELAMPADYLGLFYAAGMVQTLRWWNSQGRPVSTELLEHYSTDFLLCCFERFGLLGAKGSK